MKLAYYPGCSGAGTSKEYEASTRAVCRALGLEFAEIEDWSCCGSTPAHAIDTVLSAALGARNLIQASRTGADAVVTPCPSCLSNLKLARHRMQQEGFKAKVDALLDIPTPEDAQSLPDSFSVLQIFMEQIEPETIARRVVKPLEGMKVATYYGCLMSRPADVMKFDDPENPMALDTIMTALGAEVVPFSLKTECCGAAFGISRKDMTASLTGRILETAQAFGADAVVTACPLCHMNLDLRQSQARKAHGGNYQLPVFYYTQLMGYAFGLPTESLMLEKLVVSPDQVLTTVAARRKARQTPVSSQQTNAGAAPAQPAAEVSADQGAAS